MSNNTRECINCNSEVHPTFVTEIGLGIEICQFIGKDICESCQDYANEISTYNNGKLYFTRGYLDEQEMNGEIRTAKKNIIRDEMICRNMDLMELRSSVADNFGHYETLEEYLSMINSF